MKSMLSVKAKNVLSQYIRAEVHLIVVTSSYNETTASAKGTLCLIEKPKFKFKVITESPAQCNNAAMTYCSFC